MAPFALLISKCDYCIEGKDCVEDQTREEEPTMTVLQNKWGASFTGVL